MKMIKAKFLIPIPGNTNYSDIVFDADAIVAARPAELKHIPGASHIEVSLTNGTTYMCLGDIDTFVGDWEKALGKEDNKNAK